MIGRRFLTTRFAWVITISAKAPCVLSGAAPNTSSPFRKPVTWSPVLSTTPEKSWPMARESASRFRMEDVCIASCRLKCTDGAIGVVERHLALLGSMLHALRDDELGCDPDDGEHSTQIAANMFG
jgi:hypothetical protein